jgi:hypothetical protein
MDIPTISAIIALGILCVNILVIVIDRNDRKNKFNLAFSEAIAAAKLDVVMNSAQIQNEIYDASEKLRLEIKAEHADFVSKFGDSLPALRQKIVDVEIWSRDEFVRREDFNRAIDSFNLNLKNLGEKLENKIESLAKVK